MDRTCGAAYLGNLDLVAAIWYESKLPWDLYQVTCWGMSPFREGKTWYVPEPNLLAANTQLTVQNVQDLLPVARELIKKYWKDKDDVKRVHTDKMRAWRESVKCNGFREGESYKLLHEQFRNQLHERSLSRPNYTIPVADAMQSPVDQEGEEEIPQPKKKGEKPAPVIESEESDATEEDTFENGQFQRGRPHCSRAEKRERRERLAKKHRDEETTRRAMEKIVEETKKKKAVEQSKKKPPVDSSDSSDEEPPQPPSRKATPAVKKPAGKKKTNLK